MAEKDFTLVVDHATPKARRRKTVKVIPNVVANITPLSYERRREDAQAKWSEAFKLHLGTLNHNDFNIAQHVINLVSQKPLKIDTSYSCEVIPFPVQNKRIKQNAK